MFTPWGLPMAMLMMFEPSSKRPRRDFDSLRETDVEIEREKGTTGLETLFHKAAKTKLQDFRPVPPGIFGKTSLLVISINASQWSTTTSSYAHSFPSSLVETETSNEFLLQTTKRNTMASLGSKKLFVVLSIPFLIPALLQFKI